MGKISVRDAYAVGQKITELSDIGEKPYSTEEIEAFFEGIVQFDGFGKIRLEFEEEDELVIKIPHKNNILRPGNQPDHKNYPFSDRGQPEEKISKAYASALGENTNPPVSDKDFYETRLGDYCINQCL